jgi:hypothetical protein
MMPTSHRARRLALLGGKLLVLVLLLVSPRALLKPVEIVHKSQDSKRPKTPKNIVRAEPTRIPTADEKQGHSPSPAGAAETAAAFDADCSAVQVLPRKAYRELTKPDYLKTYLAASPHSPHSPPG